MRRFGIILLIVTIAGSLAFGQTGDARTRGMANAFTAVADDVNAIFFNPAGLAFLEKGYFVVGADASAVLSKRIMFGEEEYPYPWEYWDESGNMSYSYWDDFMGIDVFFDPSEFGFPYDPEVPGSYEQAVQDYMTWRDFYGFYQFNQNVSDMHLIPRLAYAAKNWGVSLITESSVEMATTEYRGEDTQLTFNLNKDVGVMGALGLNLGIMAVGANLKYYVRKTDTISFYAYETEDGPPDGFFADLLLGTENEESGSSHLELGVGGLFTLGQISAGAYIDNLLYFLPQDENGEWDPDLLGIFDSLSIGASFTPFNSKTSGKKGLLNLIGAVDIKNLGSETNRMLTAGVEAGLNIGDIIAANGRLGYRQDLPGNLMEMVDSFDPRLGFYTFGIGAKFIMGSLDIAAEFPADMVFEPPTGDNLPEDRLDTPFMNIVINLSLSF